ncbi:MAG: hypothetical protein ABSD75_32670 [Terriglobales bacterium]
MKPLAIADSPTIILGLQDEIRRSDAVRMNLATIIASMGCSWSPKV